MSEIPHPQHGPIHKNESEARAVMETLRESVGVPAGVISDREQPLTLNSSDSGREIAAITAAKDKEWIDDALAPIAAIDEQMKHEEDASKLQGLAKQKQFAEDMAQGQLEKLKSGDDIEAHREFAIPAAAVEHHNGRKIDYKQYYGDRMLLNRARALWHEFMNGKK